MKKWFLFLLGLVIIGVPSLLTPLMSDDLPNLIKAAHGILAGFKNWYFGENGRFSSALAILCMATWPHWLFSLINGIIGGIFFVEIAELFKLKKSWFFIPFLFVIFVLNHESCFWVAGAANYLWGATATLTWCLVFFADQTRVKCLLGDRLFIPVYIALSILCAGWHELFCAQIAILLMAYWGHQLFAERKIEINGRFWLSVGYTVGTCMLVFAPVTFTRSKSVGLLSSGFEREVFVRIVNVADVIICNPLLIVSLVVALVIFIRTHSRIAGVLFLQLMMSFFTAAIAFPLGGDGREAFVFTFVGLICVLYAVEQMECGCVCKTIVLISLCLSIFIMGRTIASICKKTESLDLSIAEWREKSYPFVLLESFPVSRIMHYIDRSYEACQYVSMGEGWSNDQIKGHYLRDECIGIPRTEFCSVLDESFFTASNRLLIEGEWYADPKSDVVACRGDFHDMKIGARLFAEPEYDKSGVSSDNLYKLQNRITRSDWGDVPGSAPDVEIISELPLKGYVVSDKAAMFFHNKHIDRRRIKKLKLTRADLFNHLKH